MSMETRITAALQLIGADIKALNVARGSLGDLTTVDKTSIVLAINEIVTAVATLTAGAAGIDDLAGNGDVSVTWSADKIYDSIETAKQAVTNSLVNGAAAALDTLNELATALGNDPAFATTIADGLALRVRVDAVQSFTGLQQTQARTNIGAVAQADFDELVTAIGDTDTDFAAQYITAKT